MINVNSVSWVAGFSLVKMPTIFPESLIRLRKFCHHWQSTATAKNHKYSHWCNGSCQDRQDLNTQHIKSGLIIIILELRLFLLVFICTGHYLTGLASLITKHLNKMWNLEFNMYFLTLAWVTRYTIYTIYLKVCWLLCSKSKYVTHLSLIWGYRHTIRLRIKYTTFISLVKI
jgi:hypothetical protein